MVSAVKWGILATGGIAECFTKDLLTNPALRGVSDVAHTVVAAASSSSKKRAEEFLTKIKAPSSAKAYGSYAELVKDPDVDIVYVATPHSHHFQNTMLCLEAGKNVLCEKAFTVNAAQAKKLVETAKAKKLFLMEAVWTRYFPLSIKIRQMIVDGAIGKVHRVVANNTINKSLEDGGIDFPDNHRMVDLNLAGGALLDLGIYSLTWVFQILYHLQPHPRKAPEVVGAIQKYEKTGADEDTCMILKFPHHAMGVAMTGMQAGYSNATPNGPAIIISGTKGEIQVAGPPYRPLSFTCFYYKDDGSRTSEEVHCPIPADPERDGWGHGMFWEADEAARCLRDGKFESKTLDWEESIVIMETMDEVRKQGGLTYPELIDTAVYDKKSPLNVGNQ